MYSRALRLLLERALTWAGNAMVKAVQNLLPGRRPARLMTQHPKERSCATLPFPSSPSGFRR